MYLNTILKKTRAEPSSNTAATWRLLTLFSISENLLGALDNNIWKPHRSDYMQMRIRGTSSANVLKLD